jgi:hypothetical protein
MKRFVNFCLSTYPMRQITFITLILASILILYVLFSIDAGQLGIYLPSLLSGFVAGQHELEFITDVSTFFGLVLGIAIPFGIEVVQSVSRNFSNSKTLRSRFRDEWQMIVLVPFYIATLLIAISSRMFINDTHPDLERAVAFTLLACLFVGILVFARYINRLYIYTLDHRRLKSEIEADLMSMVGVNKSKFSDYVEGLGDMAVSEVKNNDSKAVLTESLPFLEKLVEQIVPKGDLENAEKFLLNDEFWEMYKRGKVAKTESEKAEEDSELEDPKYVDWTEEAKMRLFFDPEKYVSSYSNILQQIERIYRQSISNKNEDLARNAVYSFTRILKYLTSEPGRDLYVEMLLKKTVIMLRDAAKFETVSKYALSTDWYTSTVFDKYGDYQFDISYLGILNKYLYMNLKFFVNENHSKLFESFIGHLVDGGMGFQSFDRIWDLSNLPLRTGNQYTTQYDEVHRMTVEIQEARNQIEKKEELEEWIKRLDALLELVLRSLSKKVDKNEAQKIYRKAKSDTIELYKSNNMIGQIFSLNVYCFFKKRYELAKKVIDYKQPDDSDASWGGNDVQPSTPNDIVAFFYRKGYYDRSEHFFEGHHGSRIYTHEYFLVLLLCALKRTGSTSVSVSGIKSAYRLSDITYTHDHLVLTVNQRLRSNKELMRVFDFSEEDIDNVLLPAIESIKNQAEALLQSLERSNSIDSKKVEEFKREVLESYKEDVVIRPLFEHFNKTVTDDRYINSNNPPRFGIYRVDQKAPFFKEWNVSYGRHGESYGSSLAPAENLHMYGELKSNVVETFNDASKALELCDLQTTVLLMPSKSLYKYEDDPAFVPKWKAQKSMGLIEEINGYGGYYEYEKSIIPVFEIGYPSEERDEFMVVDFSKAGKLKNLNPAGKETKEGDTLENLSISVQAFMDNDELMNEYISEPPKWLTSVSASQEEQRLYLMKRVAIRVFTRYKITKQAKSRIYLVLMK